MYTDTDNVDDIFVKYIKIYEKKTKNVQNDYENWKFKTPPTGYLYQIFTIAIYYHVLCIQMS